MRLRLSDRAGSPRLGLGHSVLQYLLVILPRWLSTVYSESLGKNEDLNFNGSGFNSSYDGMRTLSPCVPLNAAVKHNA